MVCAVVNAVGMISFAGGLAFLVAETITGDATQIAIGFTFAGMLLRAVGSFGSEWVAIRAGAMVRSTLRGRILATLDEQSVRDRSKSAVVLTLTRGVDALEIYFSKFLPQLIASLVITPVVVGAMWWVDTLSGLVVTLTLPLIPLFMILIGRTTSATQEKQWTTLAALSNGFSDVVRGLSTLQLFGRAERQIVTIEETTENYRRETMTVLRLSFLSGFALEIGASLAVALVAVSIGLRLVDGSISLGLGLWALLLAPEVYLPIRRVGVEFHASAEGMTAFGDIVALLDEGRRDVAPSPAQHGALVLTDVAIPHTNTRISFTANPGDIIVVRGPSGSGKTSLLEAIRRGHDGVTIGGERISVSSVSWMPQGNTLLPGTIAANIGLDPGLGDAAVSRVAALAGVDLPLDSEIGADGGGVSGGEASRIALARSLNRLDTTNASLLVLDEPTVNLDPEREHIAVNAIRHAAENGAIVVVSSHRDAVIRAATRVVEVAP